MRFHHFFIICIFGLNSCLLFNLLSAQIPSEKQLAIKNELDTIFEDKIACAIIDKEKSWLGTIWCALANVKRVCHINRLATKQKQLENNGNATLYTLWQLLRHPFDNQLKWVIMRELSPIKRILSHSHFNCSQLGSCTFAFEKNEILQSYIVKLSYCNRVETAKTISKIIEKLNLTHVAVPSKMIYTVPRLKTRLAIAERINADLIQDRKLNSWEINDIIKILIILDYLKIPFTDINPKNVLTLSDHCVLIDTESFFKIGAHGDYFPNTKAFLRRYGYSDIFSKADKKRIKQVIDAYVNKKPFSQDFMVVESL